MQAAMCRTTSSTDTAVSQTCVAACVRATVKYSRRPILVVRGRTHDDATYRWTYVRTAIIGNTVANY